MSYTGIQPCTAASELLLGYEQIPDKSPLGLDLRSKHPAKVPNPLWKRDGQKCALVPKVFILLLQNP